MAITLWNDVERGLTNTEFDNNFIELAAGCIAQSAIDNRPTVKPSLNLDFTKGILDPRITFTRSSTATYYGADGLLKTAGVNEPRFEYDPVTRQPKGLLIEESRTNLLTNSEQFSVWGRQSVVSLQGDQMRSPSGTMTADLLNGGYIYQRLSGVNPSNNTYTFSVWIYSTTAGTVQTGIASWGGAEYTQQNSIPANTWTRVIQTATFGVSAGDLHPKIYTNSPVSFYLWGAQLEQGSIATSYIPTTTAQVTRSVDNTSITGTSLSSWHRGDEGTFLIQGSYAVQNGFTNVQIGLAGNIMVDFVSRDARFNVNGTIVSYNTLGSIDATYPFLVAGAYKNNDSASSLNGAVATTNTTATVGTSTSFVIFVNKNGGTIKRIAFYPKRLTNTQLQQLTSTV